MTALPGAGYAAFAWDDNLKSTVCAYLDGSLSLKAAVESPTIDVADASYRVCFGARADGSIAALDVHEEPGSGWALTCLASTGTAVSAKGSYDLRQAAQVAWAGDRFLALTSAAVVSIALDGTFESHPLPAIGTGTYAICGAPDGGFAIFGPLEPIRDGDASSPPYGVATLRVWRYNKDGNLQWKAEWTPTAPSRILEAAADSGGLSIFVCERS